MNYNINLKEIVEKLDFDIEDVEMLLEVFLENAEISLLTLKKAIDQNDLEQIFKSAHAINGSAGNLTLREISDYAKNIEDSARERKSINYTQIFEKLKKSIEEIQVDEK